MPGMAVHIDPSGAHITVPDAQGSPLPQQGADRTLIRLVSDGGAEATIYPAVGFNLIDWRVPTPAGPVQVMHAEPDVLAGGSGTRSGCPILFPFPNRIAGATFEFGGRTYDLPPAHPGDPNAIHGFCAKSPWTQYAASGPTAVTGVFRLSRDAAAVADSWPGDLELRITFDLGDSALRLTSHVANVGEGPAPFGMGFHPYFTPLGAESLAEARLQVSAAERWVLSDLIPTGEREPVTGDCDLHTPVAIGQRVLDDVLTGLPQFTPDSDGLMARARLVGGSASVHLRCDSATRDVVVFTPANREAVAIEPYTCPTDAVHLAARESDVGWRVLEPGDSWTGVVELSITTP